MPHCVCGEPFDEPKGKCPACGIYLWEGSQASFREAGEESLAAWLGRLGWREGEGADAGGKGGWTPDEEVVERIETLGDYDVELAEREAIVERILEEEDEETIRALTELLDDRVRHPYLKKVALRVVRAYRPEFAIPVLVEQWTDEEVHEILREYPSYPEMLVDAMLHGSGRSAEDLKRGREPLYRRRPERLNERLRFGIAQHLGREGDERAVGPLLEVLEGDPGKRWEKAAEVLAELGEDRAVPLLVNRLTAEHAHDHPTIVRLLRSYDSYPAMLVEALEREDEVRVWAAIQLAGREGDGRAVPVLEEALTAGDEAVRWEAALALAKLDEREAATGPLVEILTEPDRSTSHSGPLRLGAQRFAARKLGEWKVEAAIPGLLQMLADIGDGDPEWHASHTTALAALREFPSYPELLEDALEHAEPGVRYWAAVYLAKERGVRPEEVIDPADVDRLIADLRSDDLDASWEAARKLGRLRARAASEALVEQLGIVEKNYARFATTGDQFADEDDARIGAYAHALVEIGDVTALPGVLDVLKSSSGWVARDAAHVVRGLLDGLDGIGDVDGGPDAQEAVAAMIATLKKSRVASGMKYGPEQRMRLELVEAIGRLADESALPALEEALENERDTRVRAALEGCLQELRQEGG